ncbi:MAG: hypothetical protein KGL03_04115 [Nitrospirota bacterium]|nr:hypothetical protein [Nitrospirota bacterium]
MRRRATEKTRRNPILAAALSIIFPGLGQFYNRQIKKGLSFAIGALFVIVIRVGAFDTPQPLNPEAFEATPWNNQDLFFALGPFLIGLMVWSVVDAFQTAQRSQKRT